MSLWGQKAVTHHCAAASKLFSLFFLFFFIFPSEAAERQVISSYLFLLPMELSFFVWALVKALLLYSFTPS